MSHRRRGTGFHQVLLILFGSLFFGGDSSLEKRVGREIDDPERSERARAIAAEIDAEPAGRVALFHAWREELYAAFEDPNTPDAEIRAAIEQVVQRALEADRALLDLRFQLREVVHPEEWAEIF